MNHLLMNAQVERVSNAVVAGTSSVNCTHVDMQGFERVLGICSLNTLTASQVTMLKAQAGNAADDSDMADLAGATTAAAADADSNKTLLLEVVKPTNFRYLRFVVVRGTANAAIDGVVSIKTVTHKGPESQGPTVSQALVSVDPEYSNSQLTVTTGTYGNSTTQVATTSRNAS